MLNFDFELSTQIHFGRGCIQGLPEEILKYGRRMFLIYDETSAKASGAYDGIRTLCKADGIKVIEFKQVKPKPRHTTVNEGVRMLKKTKADCIVALGGGSTIDLAKAMSFAVFHEGNCWDFYEKKVVVTRTVPVITVPTIAGSGFYRSCLQFYSTKIRDGMWNHQYYEPCL